MRIAAWFVPDQGTLADLLGQPKLVSVEKPTKLLGWQPRSVADAIAATGESRLLHELAHR